MTFFHTIEETFGLLTSAGFRVERVVEPYPYDLPNMTATAKGAIPYSSAYWETQYQRLSRVPFTIIYTARK
jgi:hypothetical protein